MCDLKARLKRAGLSAYISEFQRNGESSLRMPEATVASAPSGSKTLREGLPKHSSRRSIGSADGRSKLAVFGGKRRAFLRLWHNLDRCHVHHRSPEIAGGRLERATARSWSRMLISKSTKILWFPNVTALEGLAQHRLPMPPTTPRRSVRATGKRSSGCHRLSGTSRCKKNPNAAAAPALCHLLRPLYTVPATAG